MQRRLALVALAMGILATAGIAAARQAASTELTPQEALRLVRAVNTAEARLAASASGDGYVSLRDAITNPAFGAAAELQLEGADAARIKNYRLSLTRSEGNRGYQLSLMPASGCGAAWFSTNAGLIFTGRCLE